MVSSEMLRRVALVGTDVSEERSASIRVVSSSPILVTMMEVLSCSETSVLTIATWRNIPEDGVLHSHRRENLKSYIFHFYFTRYQNMGQSEIHQVCNLSR
jgi:hypothetical protein